MKSVVVVRDDEATKTCRNREEYLREMAVYRFRPDWAPKLLRTDGELTISLRHAGHPIDSDADFHTLGRLYAQFHETFPGLCRWDNAPSNHLYDGSRYRLVDFAETRPGFPEEDLVHFLLFWASIVPKNRFEHIMEDFLNGYRQRSPNGIDPQRWDTALDPVTRAFDERRRQFERIESNPDLAVNRQRLAILPTPDKS